MWRNSKSHRGHVVVELEQSETCVQFSVSLLFCSMTSAFLDNYEPLDIGNGSFGIIRKVRRKTDGLVCAICGTFVFPGLRSFSQIFARKELNFERMIERDRKQIVAEMCVLTNFCNLTTSDTNAQEYSQGPSSRSHCTIP